MKEQEKAKEMYEEFLPLVKASDLYDTYKNKAKRCAIIACNEIIEAEYQLMCSMDKVDPKDEYISGYWKKVIEEINKL